MEWDDEVLFFVAQVGYWLLDRKETWVPSLKLTWNLNIGHPKRKLVFQPSIFRGNMSLVSGRVIDSPARRNGWYNHVAWNWPQTRLSVFQGRWGGWLSPDHLYVYITCICLFKHHVIDIQHISTYSVYVFGACIYMAHLPMLWYTFFGSHVSPKDGGNPCIAARWGDCLTSLKIPSCLVGFS